MEMETVFEQLQSATGNCLGFKIGHSVTGEDMREMAVIMSEAIKTWGKIRLVIEIEGFRHMDPEVLLGKLRFAVEHAGDIEKVAVLSDRVWIKSWVKLGGLVSHTEVEHFDRSEIEAAWKWIGQ